MTTHDFSYKNIYSTMNPFEKLLSALSEGIPSLGIILYKIPAFVT